MESRITATELARKLGYILGRIRFRGDVFVVERNGAAVAKLSPFPSRGETSLREALTAWVGEPAAAERFADDLERVNLADRAPPNPWA